MPSGNFAVIMCILYKDCIVFPLICEAYIAIVQGFYTISLHVLQSVWGMFFYVFASVEIMKISCYSLPSKCSKTHFGDPGTFKTFWGVSL